MKPKQKWGKQHDETGGFGEASGEANKDIQRNMRMK